MPSTGGRVPSIETDKISDSKLAETQTVADSGFLVKMRSQVFVDKGSEQQDK